MLPTQRAAGLRTPWVAGGVAQEVEAWGVVVVVVVVEGGAVVVVVVAWVRPLRPPLPRPPGLMAVVGQPGQV